jgi:type I restriction enzyme S subunit
MRDGRIDWSLAKRISESTYEIWTRRLVPQPGDVILAREAPVGAAVRVPESSRVALGQRTVLLRPDPSKIEARFLYFLLLSAEMQSVILSKAEGSTVPHLNVADVRRLPIPPLPARGEQRAIAEILGALDDKIESNRRLIATSEAILEAEADLLDGDRLPLSELALVSRETVDPSTLVDGEVDLFSIPAFDAERRPERVLAASIKSGKHRVAGDAVLLSRLNPRFPRLWHVVPDLGVPALCSTEFMVLRPRDGRSLADVWLACAQPGFRDEMRQRATGTSGSHQRVRPNDVLAIEVVDPISLSNDDRQEATELLALVETARREASHLSALRDALLPALLSRRLRVTNEEIVAEAVT